MSRDRYIAADQVVQFRCGLGTSDFLHQPGTDRVQQFFFGPNLDASDQGVVFISAERVDEIGVLESGQITFAVAATVIGVEGCMQRPVLLGTRVLQRADRTIDVSLQGRTSKSLCGSFNLIERLIIISFASGDGNRVIGVKGGWVGLGVPPFPIGLVFTRFTGRKRQQRFVNLRLRSGACGQTEVGPNPVQQFIISAFVTDCEIVGVDQAAAEDRDTDIADGRDDLVDVQIAAGLLKVNALGCCGTDFIRGQRTAVDFQETVRCSDATGTAIELDRSADDVVGAGIMSRTGDPALRSDLHQVTAGRPDVHDRQCTAGLINTDRTCSGGVDTGLRQTAVDVGTNIADLRTRVEDHRSPANRSAVVGLHDRSVGRQCRDTRRVQDRTFDQNASAGVGRHTNVRLVRTEHHDLDRAVGAERMRTDRLLFDFRYPSLIGGLNANKTSFP